MKWKQAKDQHGTSLVSEQGHRIDSYETYGFVLLYKPDKPNVGIRCDSVDDAKKKAEQ